ncbi:hypothetical protein TURU_005634 [Turdus rufiventris]|nr:hypothetical protein TURU_005634 [Turdus rufiventris]
MAQAKPVNLTPDPMILLLLGNFVALKSSLQMTERLIIRAVKAQAVTVPGMKQTEEKVAMKILQTREADIQKTITEEAKSTI